MLTSSAPGFHRSPGGHRLALAIATVLLTVAVAGAQLSAPFTRITSGDLVSIPAWYWNGAWGDYDDDGYLDLFVGATFPSTRNYLYHNNHDGTFTLIDDASMPKIPSNQHGAAWGDYDNDGHLDLIVTAGNPEVTHNALYHNDGDGSFTAVTDGPIYAETFAFGFHAPSWIDYDNDGFLDLFIGGHDSHNRLFRNNGDGSFTRIVDNVLVTASAGTEGRVWFDYDDDGKLDLLVTNTAPYKAALYRNEGEGVFSSVANSALGDRVEDTFTVCVGDYDNDGSMDVFFGNNDTVALFHNEGNGNFARITDGPLATQTIASGAFGSCAWGDYDNDGFLDLFVGRACYPVSSTCQPLTSLLFRNNGDGTFANVTAGDVVTTNVTQSPGASWGDYDNDGFLDLFVSQGAFWTAPVQNLLFHNDGNSNAWLKVKLVGTVSNRSAIGAKVRVKASYRGAERWQLRTIISGDGESNQSNALDATFGLGDATSIEVVRVEWPSGHVQELHDVAPRQLLTITELPCGNGVLDPGETCEGPCCDACLTLRPAGSPCASDSNLCTGDVCDAVGGCMHIAAPDPGCAVPTLRGKAVLSMKRQAGKPRRDRLTFKWGGGPPVDRSDLGTAPASGSPRFELCIYDVDGVGMSQAFRAQAFAGVQCDGKPCWTPLGDVGWSFASKSGAPDGLTELVLKSGISGKAKMQVRGEGSLLALPSLPFMKSPAVIAQLRTSSGKCWGASFSTTLKNGRWRFKAKSD